jgi:hypothetical protein
MWEFSTKKGRFLSSARPDLWAAGLAGREPKIVYLGPGPAQRRLPREERSTGRSLPLVSKRKTHLSLPLASKREIHLVANTCLEETEPPGRYHLPRRDRSTQSLPLVSRRQIHPVATNCLEETDPRVATTCLEETDSPGHYHLSRGGRSTRSLPLVSRRQIHPVATTCLEETDPPGHYTCLKEVDPPVATTCLEETDPPGRYHLSRGDRSTRSLPVVLRRQIHRSLPLISRRQIHPVTTTCLREDWTMRNNKGPEHADKSQATSLFFLRRTPPIFNTCRYLAQRSCHKEKLIICSLSLRRRI